MTRLQFIAHGRPVTQGSTKSYPTKGGKGVRTVSKTPPLIEWREIVRDAAARAAGTEWHTQDDEAWVRLQFWVPRPGTAPKTRDVRPKRGQDLDKLERAVYDSITNAGVWTDDSRVCDAVLSKRFVVGPDLPRIYIEGYHRTAPCVVVEIAWPDSDSPAGS